MGALSPQEESQSKHGGKSKSWDVHEGLSRGRAWVQTSEGMKSGKQRMRASVLV